MADLVGGLPAAMGGAVRRSACAAPWNPVYAGIGAMLAGAVTTLLCRRDLLRGTLNGGWCSWRFTPCSCSG